jgi:uncharacterized iron-regulated membrane protein
MKNNLYNWMWKWHFIGGVISLPFVLLLAITGGIYLFKANYEQVQKDKLTLVTPEKTSYSLEKQWQLVSEKWTKTPEEYVLKNEANQASQFTSGRFSHKSSFYLNPYNGEEIGQFIPVQTDMHKVRKLHGELLLGSYGTKVIELVASWMVVLIISGIYLFWPRERGIKGLFTIRLQQGKRVLYRDLHGILGFWFSGILILILFGGFPWTDVFGTGYKWVQDTTQSGFPSTWSPHTMHSTPSGKSLTLDDFAKKAEELNLEGVVSIGLPKSATGVFSISNQTTHLSSKAIYHFDRYSGELLKAHTWEDIGLMMKSRLWVMAFHQGQFGTWNFVLVLVTAIALGFISLSALIMYIKRKPANSLGTPKVHKEFTHPKTVIAGVISLGLLLPLFGLSVVLILAIEKGKEMFNQKA